MLFNTPLFVFAFVPLTLVAYQLAARLGADSSRLQTLLFVASCIFLGIGSLQSLLLLIMSLGVNYLLLRKQTEAKSQEVKSWILAVTVTFNLCFIAAFKYANLILTSLTDMLGHDFGRSDIAIPLAISFYTFQLIALSVDCRDGKIACPPLRQFVLFTAFFPQLIAGPIVRYQEVERDLGRLGPLSSVTLAAGLPIFFVGLFKKAVVADSLAPHANTFFDGVANGGANPAFIDAWGGALCYTFQIYFDFSGYSDMAIGLAAIFGIALPANFYSPYKAASIIEFWRRWHMTLSRFLRDYLYIRLGGNKRGLMLRWRNVMLTMLIGGLWHGAAWNFMLWGGLHGLLIGANHAIRYIGFAIPVVIAWPVTFIALVLTWVVFRTPNITDARLIYEAMFGMHGVVLPQRLEPVLGSFLAGGGMITFGSSELLKLPALLIVALAAILCFFFPNSEQLFRSSETASRQLTLTRATWVALAATIGILGMQQAEEFIYFRF